VQGRGRAGRKEGKRRAPTATWSVGDGGEGMKEDEEPLPPFRAAPRVPPFALRARRLARDACGPSAGGRSVWGAVTKGGG
jgi:hypothetical protein